MWGRIAAMLPVLALAAPAWAGGGACAGQRVAIDAGHDRVRGGAESARGVPEVVFNQALAGRVKAAFDQAGIASFMTNPNADPVPLAARPQAAAAGGATLFLSLHHDSMQDKYLTDWVVDGRTRQYGDQFHGYSLFVSAKNPAYEDSLALAAALGRALAARGLTPTLHHAEPVAGENRPLLDAALGIYRYDDLVVLKSAAMPAVLLEAGVILNRAEERDLAGAARQQATAAAVVEAVTRWCGEHEAERKPL